MIKVVRHRAQLVLASLSKIKKWIKDKTFFERFTIYNRDNPLLPCYMELLTVTHKCFIKIQI